MTQEHENLRLRYRALEIMQESRWVPQRYRHAVSSIDFSREAILSVEDKIFEMQEKGQAMVLTGGVGCGKTLAMYYGAVLLMMLRREATGRIIQPHVVQAGELMDKSFHGSDWDYVKQDTPYLGIDDLGAEFMSDKGWHLARITELLDYRYARKMPTFITTNLSFTGRPSQFESRYEGRLTDRLREWGTVISVAEASMRRK